MSNIVRRGRPSPLHDKKAKANLLVIIREGGRIPYTQLQALIEDGFINPGIPVHDGFVGRPRYEYTLTGKGKTYVNFSKNWK